MARARSSERKEHAGFPTRIAQHIWGDRPLALVLWTVVAALMISLALSGGLLLRGHRLGLGASAGVQIAQLFYFSIGPTSYLFFGGFYPGIASEQGTLTATAGWQVFALEWSCGRGPQVAIQWPL